jgi:RNA polymerase-interacting CarD/CdnL/TRCF family regulator
MRKQIGKLYILRSTKVTYMANTDNDKYRTAIISSINKVYREIEKATKEAKLTDSQKTALKGAVTSLDKTLMQVLNWDFH